MIFSEVFGFLRLLLKVTEVTTEHQKKRKVSQKSVKSFFWPKGQQKPWPEAEALHRSYK